MRLNTLIIILVILSTVLHGQETLKTTCTTPIRALEKEKDYYENHGKFLEKNKKLLPGVNTRAYTQSIHNVIAKWDGGSFQSFRIGTAPGLQNIKWGQGLGGSARHTGGHSYEELRLTALNNPGGATNFNIGDEFYITMDAGLGSEWVSPPLKFEWENLGDPSNTLTIQIETNYGVNGLGPFADWQRDKMTDFYNLVNPIIEEVYGPPSRNHEVFIVNDGNAVGTNTFYNGPNQISSTYQENGDGDLDQPRLMIHELVHAYRDNVTVSSDEQWHYDPTLSGFEEGMAEAVGVIVMDIFIGRYPGFFNGDEFKVHWTHARGMPFDWDYDFQNHSQLTTTDFFSSDIGTGAHWERYGTSQAAMQKMYVEDPEIFKKFNTEYYRRLNANHDLVPTRTLAVDIFSSVLNEVERTPTVEWINDQRIFDCTVVPGNKVHMLTFHSVDPPRIHTLDNRVHVLKTQNLPDGNEWFWDENDPVNNANSKRWYIQTNNLDGQLQIFNYDNSLHQSVNIRNNKSSLRDGGPEYLGPYQGGNFLRYNGVFTGNDGRNDCTQPSCGKRPVGIDTHNFRATSTADRNHNDLPNNLPDPTSQIVSDLSELGLYKYEISFEGSNYQGTYYRLHGEELAQKDGIIGGIKSMDDSNLITGKLIIEHQDFGEEADIIINNGTFISDRSWASVPESESHRQGGRSDRRYSVPGKVHAIFISEDCTKHKIDFRNIRYGDGLAGSQLLLFTVDDFEDIKFATDDASLCEGDPLTLEVNNNFPDILDGDSRISYRWLDPNNNEISTNVAHTIPSVTEALHEGIYTLEINFFGCIISLQSEISIDNIDFEVITPNEITLCEQQTLELEVNLVNGATYSWSGPNGFTASTRQIFINAITIAQQGEYIVNVTAPNCNNISTTKASSTNVIINSSITLTLNTNDISACEGQNVLLTVNEINNVSYSWSGPNGFSANTREVAIDNISEQDEGEYIVTATSSNCDGSAIESSNSLIISTETIPSIDLDNIPNEVRKCVGENFNQRVNLYENASYLWEGPNNFTSIESELSLANLNTSNEGLYTISISIDACNTKVEESQSIFILIEPCSITTIIPTYFTPNGDGFHDSWLIDDTVVSFNYIYIFDRYGKLLTQLTPGNNNWDGNYNGKQMPSSEYWYTIMHKDNRIEKGHFSLIR